MALTANPINEGVLLSHAPNVFTLPETSNATEDDYRLEVVVEVGGNDLITMSRIPNGAGVAHFEMREILRQTKPLQIAKHPTDLNNTSASIHYIPSAGTYPQRCQSLSRDNVVADVALTFNETYTDGSGNFVRNKLDDVECVVIHGALQHPELSWDAINYKVVGAYDDQRLALPLTIRDTYEVNVKDGDNGVVSYFMNDGTVTANFFKLRLSYYDAGGNLLDTSERDIPADFLVDDTNYAVQFFAVYPDNLERQVLPINNGMTRPSAVPTWATYTFDLLDRADGIAITEPVSFIRECDTAYENIRLGFVNDLGGWDYVNFDLKAQENIDADRNESERVAGSWSAEDFELRSNDRGLDIENSTSRTSYTISKRVDATETKVIAHMINSREVVWLKQYNAPVAVRLTSNDVRIKRTGDSDYNTVTLTFETAIKTISA